MASANVPEFLCLETHTVYVQIFQKFLNWTLLLLYQKVKISTSMTTPKRGFSMSMSILLFGVISQPFTFSLNNNEFDCSITKWCKNIFFDFSTSWRCVQIVELPVWRVQNKIYAISWYFSRWTRFKWIFMEILRVKRPNLFSFWID